MLWTITYESTEDAMIRANALKHLRALRVDDDVAHLEAIVQQYAARIGRLPTSFMELVENGYLRRIPVDPLGHAYKLAPGGRVEVEEPDALPFITKGLPPGAAPSVTLLKQN